MKQFFSAYVLACLVTLCNQPNNTKTTQSSPVDSLVGAWIKNWSSHDSTAVKNMFDSDAVLIDDNMITNNQDELFCKRRLVENYGEPVEPKTATTIV